jgi:cytokinin dehydrogenase
MSESRWSTADVAALAAATGASVRHDAATRAAFAEDFGHLTRAEPRAVVSPRTADEIVAIVELAARRKLPLCPRGRGYSQSGQSLSPEGLCLDLSRLDRIGPVDVSSRLVACEPGVRWRELVSATLREGLIPRVLPLSLDMSVAGLLSAGGIGTNSHRHGPVVSQLAELEVVTGDGKLSRCTATTNGDLFAAVLGGLGRFGVVARASLALRPVPARVKTFHLVYFDMGAWLADQERVVGDRRAEHLEALCWMGAKGFRRVADSGARVQWLYGLQLGFEYDQVAPDRAAALAGLSPAQVVHVDDETAADFATRYQPRFDGMHRSGAWQQVHPWLECLIPARRMATLLPTILGALPASLGDGHRIMWVDPTRRPPFFAVPVPPSDPIVCFAVLPAGVAAAEREEVLPALARVDRLLRDAGGKRYLSGWLGPTTEERWREHHGEAYPRWLELKRRFDPDGIFRSAHFPD